MDKNQSKIPEDDLLAYGAYVQVAVSLQHSNRIQMQYKVACSTWLLATFIGVGYSLSSREPNLPIDSLLTASILAFASLFVVSRLWYLDLIVQEKSIASAVFAGLSLEKQHSWLPQVYGNVVKMQNLFGYVAMKSMFYLATGTILLLLICATLTAYMYLEHLKYWLIVPFGTAGLIGSIFVLVSYITKRLDPYSILKKIKQI